MNNSKIRLIILLLFISSVSCSYASEDRIIAVVNDEVITSGEIQASGSKVFPSTSLSFLIEKKLQLQTARKKGISASDTDIEEALNDIKKMNSFKSDEDMKDALLKEGISLEDYIREIREQIIILKVVNREVKSKISVSDKEIENYYQAHKSDFRLPESIKIGYVHVPVRNPDSEDEFQKALRKINNVREDLNNNLSISDLRKRYSDSRDINFVSDLGFVKRGDLMPELENPAFSLREGETSDVIKTSMGLYVIKKIEIKKMEYKPLDEVKDIIRDLVFQEKSEGAYREWIFNLKTSSYINLYI